MKKRKLMGGLVVIGTAAGLTVWAHEDLSAYEQKLCVLQSPERINAYTAKTEFALSEVSRINGCRDDEVGTEFFSTAERACAIAAMLDSTTYFGGMASANAAYRWLKDHPGDQEVREAALQALSNARAYLASSKPEYDDYQALLIANDRSVIRSLIYGRLSTGDQFSTEADDLDHAEFTVMLPQLATQQMDWRHQTEDVRQ